MLSEDRAAGLRRHSSLSQSQSEISWNAVGEACVAGGTPPGGTTIMLSEDRAAGLRRHSSLSQSQSEICWSAVGEACVAGGTPPEGQQSGCQRIAPQASEATAV